MANMVSLVFIITEILMFIERQTNRQTDKQTNDTQTDMAQSTKNICGVCHFFFCFYLCTKSVNPFLAICLGRRV